LKRKRETVGKLMTAGKFFARIGGEFAGNAVPWTAVNAAEAMR